MLTKQQQVMTVIGVVGGMTALILLATRAEAGPPPPPPPPERANLYGKVTDNSSGQPIAGVLVTLNSMQTQTDVDGSYAFTDIQPGDYTATFSKAGYQTISL